MWQDSVITIINIILAYALIPQVYYGFKKKVGPITLQTGIINTTGVYVMTFVFFTLELYFSATTMFIIGSLWLTLLIQRVIYKKK